MESTISTPAVRRPWVKPAIRSRELGMSGLPPGKAATTLKPARSPVALALLKSFVNAGT
jgi:hypothetical protein